MWSDIWSRFEIELDKLMDLTVWWNVDADIPDEHVESENTRYSVLDVCVGYVHGEFRWSVIRMQNPPYHIPIRGEEHDNPALERLQRNFFFKSEEGHQGILTTVRPPVVVYILRVFVHIPQEIQ